MHVVSDILPGRDCRPQIDIPKWYRKLTFLSMTNTYVHMHVHCENRSLIQSLALMRSATKELYSKSRVCDNWTESTIHPSLIPRPSQHPTNATGSCKWVVDTWVEWRYVCQKIQFHWEKFSPQAWLWDQYYAAPPNMLHQVILNTLVTHWISVCIKQVNNLFIVELTWGRGGKEREWEGERVEGTEQRRREGNEELSITRPSRMQRSSTETTYLPTYLPTRI